MIPSILDLLTALTNTVSHFISMHFFAVCYYSNPNTVSFIESLSLILSWISFGMDPTRKSPTHSSLCLPITAVLSLPCFHPTRMRLRTHFISIAQHVSDTYTSKSGSRSLPTSFFHYATASESVQTCKSHLQMCECHCTRTLRHK